MLHHAIGRVLRRQHQRRQQTGNGDIRSREPVAQQMVPAVPQQTVYPIEFTLHDISRLLPLRRTQIHAGDHQSLYPSPG